MDFGVSIKKINDLLIVRDELLLTYLNTTFHNDFNIKGL